MQVIFSAPIKFALIFQWELNLRALSFGCSTLQNLLILLFVNLVSSWICMKYSTLNVKQAPITLKIWPFYKLDAIGCDFSFILHGEVVCHCHAFKSYIDCLVSKQNRISLKTKVIPHYNFPGLKFWIPLLYHNFCFICDKKR